MTCSLYLHPQNIQVQRQVWCEIVLISLCALSVKAMASCVRACARAFDNSMSGMVGSSSITTAPLLNLRKRLSEQLEDDFSPTQMAKIQNAIMRITAAPEVGNKSSLQLAELVRVDLSSQVDLIGELIRVDLIGKVDLIGELVSWI